MLKIHMKYHRPFLARISHLLSALLFGGMVMAPSAFAATSSYTWTDSSTTDTATHGLSWHSLASSASGQHLVAGLYLDDVWRSSDYGATWTNTTTANPAMHGYNWQAAASDASGQHLVIGAYQGDIWTSSDYGAHWTDVSTGHAAITYKTWFSLASDATGKYLVGAVLNGDIFTSSDYGATWTDRTPSGAAHQKYWQAMTSDASGQHLAGAVRDGDIFTSNDYGVTWTDDSATTDPATSDLTWWYMAANGTGQRLTAVDRNDDIWTSSDYGAHWTDVSESTATGTHGLNWQSLSLSGTGQYQIASANTNGIWTSADYGATWTKSSLMSGLNWASVRLSADGRHAVAQGGSGDTYTGVNTDAPDSATVPNSNDANGDGVQDYNQGNLQGSLDSVTGQYALVQAGSDCAVSDQSVAAAATQDASYTYPAGLMNFTLQGCGATGFTTTVTQYYYGVNGSDFVLRKYNSTTKQYATVAGATIAHVTINGQDVTKVSYQVTDGGSLDEDGTANGVIVDPAGLAAPIATPTGLTDTGYDLSITGILSTALITLAVATRYSSRRKQDLH